MPFSQTKYEKLQRDIRLILASTHINDWERSFLRDMQAKLTRYGTGTRFSDKQYRRLMSLTAGITLPPTQGPRHRRQNSGATSYASRCRSAAKRQQNRSWAQALLSMLFALALFAFLILWLVERFPEKLGPLVSMTSTSQVSGPVTRVRDGDTIEVNGVPIRFGSLDCAERGTSAGRLATGRMRELISGETLQCFLNGRTSYDRKIGSCRTGDDRDLANIMIEEGYCRRYW